jgi:hypothetical protein
MHYDRIPELLDHLIVCSVAEAARRVGMNERTVWRYLVNSKLGHESLQQIDWCGVVAPFHVQVENARQLAVEQITQSAIERARDGVLVDVFFQGQRQYEKVKKPQFQTWTDAEIENLGFAEDAYEMIPTKQWLKPSDALVLAMLQAYRRKRFGQHSTVEHAFSGTLRIDKPDAAKTVEHNVFEEQIDEAEQPKQLALASPLTPEGVDAAAAAGAYDPRPVVFVAEDGTRTELIAPDPLAPRETDSPLQSDLKAKARELRERGAQPARGAHGERTLVSIPGHVPDDDIPDDVPLRRPPVQQAPQPSPASQPSPPRAPTHADPSTVPGVTIDGRPTIARGFKQV